MILAELTYTAPEVLLIIAGIGGMLTGVGASIVSIVTAIRTTGRFDKTDAKVDEVHKLTNDRAMKQDVKIVELEKAKVEQDKVISGLIAIIATKDKSAAVIEARTEQAAIMGPPPEPKMSELHKKVVDVGEEIVDTVEKSEDAIRKEIRK